MLACTLVLGRCRALYDLPAMATSSRLDPSGPHDLGCLTLTSSCTPINPRKQPGLLLDYPP